MLRDLSGSHNGVEGVQQPETYSRRKGRTLLHLFRAQTHHVIKTSCLQPRDAAQYWACVHANIPPLLLCQLASHTIIRI